MNIARNIDVKLKQDARTKDCIISVNEYQIGFDSRHVYYLVPRVAH